VIEVPPLLILAVGVLTVVGMIVVLRINAFMALITAAFLVSLLAPGPLSGRISRVAGAFGATAGEIGIVIALAAVIGRCMMDSGAADRIVRGFLSMLGEKRGGTALMGSGFVLSVPVFFDTVFYLLVPLARSMFRRTGRDYLKYLMAIAAGGAITHTLVPPTPGPLVIAGNLGVNIGTMIMIGALVALPAGIAGLIFARWVNARMPVPMRPVGDESAEDVQPEAEPPEPSRLPGLAVSLLPVVLPVALIATHTVLSTYAETQSPAQLTASQISDWSGFRSALSALRNGDEEADAEAQSEAAVEPAGPVVRQLPDDLAAAIRSDEPLSERQRRQVVEAINDRLDEPAFGNGDAFREARRSDAIDGPEETRLLEAEVTELSSAQIERRNRLLLEGAFPELIERHDWNTPVRSAAQITSVLGNANLAMAIAAAIAILLVMRQRQLGRREMAQVIEHALMASGVIILITAAGGAFGEMLKTAEVGEAIKAGFSGDGAGESASGLMLLLLAFGVASLIKISQGSSTVAMITTSGMLAAMITAEGLSFHPVYLATTIGSGSLFGSWMNDSGFWIFTKMGGLTEVESLKSWTPLLAVLGATAFLATVVLAMVMPMA
jgi:H+/gluconate symporter-like permease